MKNLTIKVPNKDKNEITNKNNDEQFQWLKQHIQKKEKSVINSLKIKKTNYDSDYVESYDVSYKLGFKIITDLNKKLITASKNKNDEFYTLLEDVQNELRHYHNSLRDKVIYLPCDHHVNSNFWKYLYENYETIKYKKIICTSINDNNTEIAVFDGKTIIVKEHPSGKFQDNLPLFKSSDVIITNPPFSLFTEFYKILRDCQKSFLIIGHLTAINRHNLFEDVKNNLVDISPKNLQNFLNPSGSFAPVCGWWYYTTDLIREEIKEVKKPHNFKTYYDSDIAFLHSLKELREEYKDYDGVMAVPITIAQKRKEYNVELVGIVNSGKLQKRENISHFEKYIHGKRKPMNMLPAVVEVPKEKKTGTYFYDTTTDKYYREPFSRILVKWKK